MSKNHSPGPVPAGNRPHAGTAFKPEDEDVPNASEADKGESFQEEDPKRRLGDYTGTGEHARQQPGPKNDGGKRHGEDAG